MYTIIHRVELVLESPLLLHRVEWYRDVTLILHRVSSLWGFKSILLHSYRAVPLVMSRASYKGRCVPLLLHRVELVIEVYHYYYTE